MFRPSGLPFDRTSLPAVELLMHSSSQTSLMLDSLQQRVDLTIWPELLEYCFSFVANYQMFANTDIMFRNPDKIVLSDGIDDPKKVIPVLESKIETGNEMDYSSDPDMKSLDELTSFIRENARIAIETETLLSELALQASKKVGKS